jgi:hypothetical protein
MNFRYSGLAKVPGRDSLLGAPSSCCGRNDSMFQKETIDCVEEADECRLQAVRARTSEDRAAWLELAEQWLRLAHELGASSEGDNEVAEPTLSHAA